MLTENDIKLVVENYFVKEHLFSQLIQTYDMLLTCIRISKDWIKWYDMK